MVSVFCTMGWRQWLADRRHRQRGVERRQRVPHFIAAPGPEVQVDHRVGHLQDGFDILTERNQGFAAGRFPVTGGSNRSTGFNFGRAVTRRLPSAQAPGRAKPESAASAVKRCMKAGVSSARASI